MAGLAASLVCLLLAGSAVLAAGEKDDRPRPFGHSVEARPLEVSLTGPNDARTRVMVIGVIHGNETAGRQIVSRLRQGREPGHLKLWTVLKVNPDGDAANTRQNARGVDLNRNFPGGWRPQGSPWSTYYSGPRPASEPETRAAMRLIDRVQPDVTIWYHQQMNLVVEARGADPRVYRRYARAANMWVERLPRYPGTAPRWQNRRLAESSAFVVELPAGALSPAAVRRHVDAVLAAGRAA